MGTKRPAFPTGSIWGQREERSPPAPNGDDGKSVPRGLHLGTMGIAFPTSPKWERWGWRSSSAPNGDDGEDVPHEHQMGILAEGPRLTILPMLAIVSERETTEVESLRSAQPPSPA